MNYEETMDYIKSKGKSGWNFGLDRMLRVLEALGNPQESLKCIHVAGTNGKGSVCAMLNQILIEAGYKVGMYTSPYLQEFEERIQINNHNISKNDLSANITRVKAIADKICDSENQNPTEFEIETCAMFLYFSERKVDYAVIEVGLGGRSDATNVIMPVLSIIASISFDHMNILGNTLSKIAYEKGGIIKKNVPLVLYPQEDESLRTIREICRSMNSDMILVPVDSVYLSDNNKKNDSYQNIIINTPENHYEIELSLLGKHQLLNCATAIFAAEKLVNLGLKISKKNIIDALVKVKWPGRLEIMSNFPLVVIDGAHNIDGIKRLKESVDNYFQYDKMILIIGILADKQVEKMVSIIAKMAVKVIAVAPHSDRAENSEKLQSIVKKYTESCISFDDYEDAYKYALKNCSKNDLLLISGSLYMIGDMRKIIKKFQNEGKI